MRIIIFNDKQNFDGSLSLLSKSLRKDKNRFWDYGKYIPFLIEKVESIDKLKNQEIKLIKTFFYTGRYNSKLITSLKWSCGKKIGELDYLIKKEHDLLNYISQQKLSNQTRKKVNAHVEGIKKIFEERKKEHLTYIEKQKRNFKGQQELIKDVEGDPFIEIKSTPLKQSRGEVYQKGVDVMLATDLVNLAHTDAYDIALILGGDTDFVESVKLVRKNLSKIVIVVAYHTQGDPQFSNISDLKKVADYFINLKDLSEEEINSMSELRRNQ